MYVYDIYVVYFVLVLYFFYIQYIFIYVGSLYYYFGGWNYGWSQFCFFSFVFGKLKVFKMSFEFLKGKKLKELQRDKYKRVVKDD